MFSILSTLAAIAALAAPYVGWRVWKGMRAAEAPLVRAGAATAFLSVMYVMICLVFVGFFEGLSQSGVASSAGFESADEMKAAKIAGVSNKADYDAFLAHQAAEVAAEEAKAAEKKRVEDDAKLIACRQEISCWSERFAVDVEVECPPVIERLAKYDHEWTDGMFERKFTRSAWKDQKAGIVTFLGDELKLQNGFGAWSHYTYACVFDTSKKKIVDVMMEQGRM